MSFNKNGETQVYREKDKIGKKFANENKSNRYTVDDLVEDSDADREVSLTVEETSKSKDSEDKDVSN